VILRLDGLCILARLESSGSGQASQNPSRQDEGFGQYIPEFSVVVPTLNEADNIEPLLAKAEMSLKGVRWEITFIDDDSQNCTRDVILRRCRIDPRV